ncbi:hypothetical protein HGRIS_003341 [Hohenbuehelia grisea]|uniref:Arrestin-like N-terminal domain-containing protein n=1 Tax=Hohenbuehelia grisea TaxID=104357 RepID=A0ABR3JG03_9AGAR
MAAVAFAPPPQYSVSRRFSARPAQVPQTAGPMTTTFSIPAAPTMAPSVDAPPPSYTCRRRRDTISALPRREPVEHVYPLVDGRSRAWAILRVFSSAKSSKSLPTFYEGEDVKGRLELELEKGESIQAITVSLTGRIITGSGSSDSHTFLNDTHTLWSKSSSSNGSRTPSPTGGSGKLQGACSWPFSLALPSTVRLPFSSARGQTVVCPLPETFNERGVRAVVQYDITLKVVRGKLRADNTITTAFGYVPSSRPQPPSMLRQLAYQEGCPLPGPEVDPEGWQILPPFVARGVVFSARMAEARCHLAIAKPLSYTRGTVIPCSLSMDSRDSQALDLLSQSRSIAVVLRRLVRYFSGSTNKDLIEDVGRAIWWPTLDGRGDEFIRYLEGEIPLAKDLKPSCNVAHFSISYFVTVCPFDSTGFASSDSDSLLSEPVEIASMHAKGPKPRSCAPPSYVASRQADAQHSTLRRRPTMA